MYPYDDLFQCIMDGDERKTVSLCEGAIANGYHPMDILEKGMIPAMDHLGSLLSKGEMFIPQILVSARAMQDGLEIIQPKLLGKSTPLLQHTVVVGTVRGDIHSIGKNLVAVVLRATGFQVVDLGVNVSAEQFIKAIRENKAQSVAMSALLTTSMQNMRKIVKRLRQEDFGYPLQIIVGGGPITASFAREVQATFAANMMETAQLVQAASQGRIT